MTRMTGCQAAIESVASIAAEFQIDSLWPQIRACKEVAHDGGIVDVAILGRFKAGKSSLLNRVVSRSVLPVGVLPVTAVITRLSFGPANRTIVHRADLTSEEVPLEALAEFVTEQRNPGNVKQVTTVDVELACLEPYGRIRFVDTPGLGSIHAHNTKTSREWLPMVGAALVAICIDQPLSDQDVDLLRELEKHTPEIAILLTKVDLVSEDRRAEVIDFLRDQVDRYLGRQLRIFPFSSQRGYEGLRDALREYLLEHICARQAQALDEIAAHKVRSLVLGCRGYLRLAEQAALGAEHAKDQLARVLADEHGNLGTIRHEILLLLTDLKAQLRDAAANHLQVFRLDLLGRLLDQLEVEPTLNRGTLWEMTEAYQSWVGEALKRELEPISQEEGARLLRFLDETESTVLRVVRAFQDRLSLSIEQALHVKFKGAQFTVKPMPPRQPDVHVGRIFDVPVQLLSFLVPMWLFRPMIVRHFRGALPWQVKKNLYRLASQWSDRLSHSIDDMAQQAIRFIKAEIDTIERLVSGTESRLAGLRLALDRLGTIMPADTRGSGLAGKGPSEGTSQSQEDDTRG
ncbi:MAG: dynamin family protein [Candidatus Riflebacteria bacterium]|nr:dynamin family protein [Candidatus Riflebacteria bacterium]